jgi:hypothetical protein
MVIDDDLTSFEEACNKADAEEARRLEVDELARLAKLPKLEYDRQRDEAAARLGVRVPTLDKAVRERRSADHDAATLPHWKVEPSPLPVDGAKLLDALRQVFRHYIVLPPGADIALALWVLHAWTMDAGEISPFMVLVSPTKRCFPATENVPASVIRARRREHSRKPEASYALIERMFPDLPKLELFARQTRPGWEGWGNETEKFREVAS